MLSKGNFENELPSYEEIENNNAETNYDVAPYDETQKQYQNYSDNINVPDHEIIGVSGEFLTTNHTIYCIREGFSKFTSNTIVVLNNENKEVFNCKSKSDKIVLYDCNKKPIINSKVRQTSSLNGIINEKIIISSGKEDNKKYGIVNGEFTAKLTKHSEVKHLAEFINLASNEKEQLELRGSVNIKLKTFTKDIYVYCNPGKDNETMIGKITCENNGRSKLFTVEIAPNVDAMYMISLCLGFYKLDRPYLYRKRNK